MNICAALQVTSMEPAIRRNPIAADETAGLPGVVSAAVGLDLVTILVAFELRHYLTSVAGLVRVPPRVAVHFRNPALWLYACMWPVIWIRTLKGTLRATRWPARIAES